MVDVVYKVWCEWEIGIEQMLFKTPEGAIAAARKALEGCCMDETYEELNANGLIGLRERYLHP